MGYQQLWKQIEARLRAAFGLLRTDAPDVASGVASVFEDWLSHNELELALEALEDAAFDGPETVRPRFWEEALTAAMLMGSGPVFERLAKRVDVRRSRPRPRDEKGGPSHICCDFNGLIEQDVYCLDAVGTALDFAAREHPPRVGEWIVLYDHETLEDDSPGWLLADAQLIEIESWGLVARTKPDSFRAVPRSDG